MKEQRKQNGITLIALVVTIVVLLILAGVSLSLVIGDSGIITRAQEASRTVDTVEIREQILMELAGMYAGSGSYTNDDVITAVKTVMGEATQIEVGQKTITTPKGNKVDISDLWLKTKVTVTGTDGTILTKDNYAQYLGRIVTNYKATGETEAVTTTTSNYSSVNTFTVSTTYRLYYIDFDGKYGDAGTVYLKADCTANNYTLSTSLPYNTTTSKIQSLNPSLYASGVTTPTTSNENMKAVTWLLDSNEWKGLVTSGASTAIEDKVNYVVGAPSFEMFCDSYNAYYGLTGDTPSTPTGSSTVTERRKIFYYYPYNTSNYGYAVGPGYSSSGTVTNYFTYSSYYLVLSDSDIDSMYYPGSSQRYWLASPSAHNSSYVMFVNCYSGGSVNWFSYSDGRGGAFCPLVSLQPDVLLELE